jgi:D-glycero-D-manno-heptose 1,7-bisphosphate phosphatase
MPAQQKAVFIDRDGVLDEMVYDEIHGLFDSPRRPEQVRLIPGSAEFVKGIKGLGYLGIVVTNQPGIAKGTISLQELQDVNQKLLYLLGETSQWDDLAFCPHYQESIAGGRQEFIRNCDCRKPKPGLLLQMAEKHNIELASSWMIGDGLNDIQAGNAAGCRTILLSKLKVEQIERFLSFGGAVPSKIAANLQEALQYISDSE